MPEYSNGPGNLHVILGPMFSGKTTRLIELTKKHDNYVIINYAGDTRYHPTLLSTHDRRMVPCIQSYDLTPLLCHRDVITSDAVFINEGQFFKDLYYVVRILVEEQGKNVIVCGLDADFRREPFGDMIKLITLCDTVEKLRSKCVRCGMPAPFTWRTTSEQSQVFIGSDEYVPLCRGCYLVT